MSTSLNSHQAVIPQLMSPIGPGGAITNCSSTEIFSIDAAEVEAAQLAGIRLRFEQLRDTLPALTRVADMNRVHAIESLDDVVPLLFPHTAYKSYPVSLIEKSQFPRLTEWLSDYTTHDLSAVDAGGCESLDDWLDMIEKHTPVRVLVSSGTSGKVSLLPKSVLENSFVPSGFFNAYSPFAAGEPGMDDAFRPDVYHVKPFARRSRHSTGVIIDTVVDRFAGDETHVFSLGGEMSTDLLWMTGRMKKAQSDGTLESLKRTPAWVRLQDRSSAPEAAMTEALPSFFRRVLTELRGKAVVLQFGINYYSTMAQIAEQEGLDFDFAPDSMFNSGGGLKGNVVTDEQVAKVFRTVPGPITELYGFSEVLNGSARKCAAGMYHPPQWVVRYVLDPDTGVPYPRTGVRTGRYAAFDLWAQTYWGGFVSGDEVTIDWDGGCACGRQGSFLYGQVGRYSDLRGGNDKITCQRTAAAVQEVVDQLRSDDV